ncbi:MAG TPA: glutaredoxin domain-containing protein [Candidatus Paceibacterota bacterium]|nr:glutaredoxin domain-containing protein [Candidatus Paceibacterota bacterium]
MPSVLMYTTPTCVYCREAKEFFKEHNVEYEEKDVVQDEQARNDMIQKSGQMGVPVIDVNGEIVIGYNKKKLVELLGIQA